MSLFNRSKKSARPSSKKPAFRPSLEALGDRIVPATTWMGQDGDNWNDITHWSNGIPDANDQVTFNTSGTSVMDLPDVNAVVAGISFDAPGTVILNLVNSLRISSPFNLDAISVTGPQATILGPGAIVFVGGGTYGVGAANGSTLSTFANLTGSGQIEFSANTTGDIRINGDITVNGTATVVSGSLIVAKDNAVITTPLVVGDGVGAADTAVLQVASNTQITVNDMTVAADGFVLLPMSTQITTADLTLASGTGVDGTGRLVLTGTLSAPNAAATVQITTTTEVSGSVAIDAGGAAAVDLLFSGPLTGLGTATFGGGTVRIGGTDVNPYIGTAVVSGATLELAKPDGVAAIGNAKLGGSLNDSVIRLINPNQIRDGADVTMPDGVNGVFDLNGKNETINDLLLEPGNTVSFGGATLTTTGTVTLAGSDIQMGGGKLVLQGPLNATAFGNDKTVQIAGGTVDASGGTRTIDVAANVTLQLNAALANGTFVKDGPGLLRGFTNSNAAAQVNVSEGTVNVLGLIPNVNFATVGGTLQGSGQIGKLNATSGTVQPDVPNTPLRTANLVGSLAPTFLMKIFQINQSAQISTTGTVDLNSSKLVLDAPGNLPIGSAFTLVINDGNDPIQNAFFLVPEGKLVQANGQTFRISYVGGTGNDVTATVVVGSQTALSSSAGNTIRAGLSTTLTAVVTSAGNASGTVKFMEGNTLLGESAVQGGVATLPFAFAEGPHAITAIYSGDADVLGSTSAVLNLTVNPELYAVGAGKGGSTAVTLRNTDGTIRATMNPFADSFTGGVRVASADINGDGFPDLIAGTGPGVATQVRVLDGKTGAEIFSVAPFEAAFTGGVYVSAADMNGDGFAEFAITPDEGGGPRLRLFDGQTFAVLADFFGIDDPAFRGGARAAFADLSGDGASDLLLSAGFGGGPRVAGYDGAELAKGNTTAKLFNDFFAFEPELRNGAFLAGGDLNGDGFAELVGGGGPGGGPRVTAFDGADLMTNTLTPVANFFAGDPNNRGGVPVGVKQLTADTAADILAGAGFTGGSKVTAYNGEGLLKGNADPLHSFDAFAGFLGGVFVG